MEARCVGEAEGRVETAGLGGLRKKVGFSADPDCPASFLRNLGRMRVSLAVCRHPWARSLFSVPFGCLSRGRPPVCVPRSFMSAVLTVAQRCKPPGSPAWESPLCAGSGPPPPLCCRGRFPAAGKPLCHLVPVRAELGLWEVVVGSPLWGASAAEPEAALRRGWWWLQLSGHRLCAGSLVYAGCLF